jgi:hypothetical protein
MNLFRRHWAMTALRVTLAAVVLERSCVFVFGRHSAEAFRHTGWPDALRLALGGCEIVAAVLFLVPRTMWVGGTALLAAFAVAACLHVLHGDYDVGALMVWSAAVVAVVADWRSPEAGAVGG